MTVKTMIATMIIDDILVAFKNGEISDIVFKMEDFIISFWRDRGRALRDAGGQYSMDGLQGTQYPVSSGFFVPTGHGIQLEYIVEVVKGVQKPPPHGEHAA